MMEVGNENTWFTECLLSNRVEITLGITNPPSGRIVKRLLADAVTKGMIEVL